MKLHSIERLKAEQRFFKELGWIGPLEGSDFARFLALLVLSDHDPISKMRWAELVRCRPWAGPLWPFFFYRLFAGSTIAGLIAYIIWRIAEIVSG